jgi:hypothetical protein
MRLAADDHSGGRNLAPHAARVIAFYQSDFSIAD